MAFTTNSTIPPPLRPVRSAAAPPVAEHAAEAPVLPLHPRAGRGPIERSDRPRAKNAEERPEGRGREERAASPADSAPMIHPSLVARLAVLAYEVLEGVRSPVQLHGMVTEEVATELRERSRARAESRTVNRDHRRRVPGVSRVALTRPEPHVVEATALLEAGMRVHAVAVCLKFSAERQQWRAHCLTVL